MLHPKKGRAVLFYTHNLQGEKVANALHGSCPVGEGEKWIMQAWFRDSVYPDSPHYVRVPKREIGDGNRSAVEGSAQAAVGHGGAAEDPVEL